MEAWDHFPQESGWWAIGRRGTMLHVEEIRVNVAGLPPAKSEAKSMLAAGHSHHERVVALLTAVRAATEGEEVPVFGADPVGLELVLGSPTEPASDATNYLGGVGDVLEVKSGRGPLAHLRELASVALFLNDKQIHRIQYRWELAAEAGYMLRVWRL